MIIHASKAFIEKFGCLFSCPDRKPAPRQAFDGWSGDLLKVSHVGQAAVMMNDASLAMIIVPLEDVRRFEEFLPVFLFKVSEMLGSIGGTLDPANQTAVILRRSNRSLIGSMNNAKDLIAFTMLDQMEKGAPVDWNEAEHFINHTPFSVIDYETPIKTLASLLISPAR